MSLKAHCTFNMQTGRWLNYVTTFFTTKQARGLFNSFIMKLLHVSQLVSHLRRGAPQKLWRLH